MDDYTKVPRALIYKERENLNEFGVQTEGTLNHYLFNQMRRMTLLRVGAAKQIALQCLNNAYYICTLTQLDEFPDTCMDKYEKTLLQVDIPFKADVYQASMALVCILLAAYDDKFKQKDNLLIDSIHHWTSANKWTGSASRNSFENIIEACSPEGFSLPGDVFAPRDIIEMIEVCPEKHLFECPEYICERLLLIEDKRRREHGADMSIARLKDYQLELCKETDYAPKKDCFKYADGAPYCASDIAYEDRVRALYRKSKEAIAYYKEHYPKEAVIDHKHQAAVEPVATGKAAHVAEVAQLNNRISELSNNLKEKEEENQQLREQLDELKEKLEEALTIPEDITAVQKVRMELARKLMEKAGITEQALKKYGNKDKAGSLMSTLLGFSANTCKTYISTGTVSRDRHKETIDEINSLLKDLEATITI